MAYQKMTGKRNYFKYAECKPGQQLVKDGIYMGTEPNKFNADKEDHLFKLPTDEFVVLNAAGHLDKVIEKHLTKGQRCNVFFRESKPIEGGKFAGKVGHLFDLEVDDESGVSTTVTTTSDLEATTPGLTV